MPPAPRRCPGRRGSVTAAGSKGKGMVQGEALLRGSHTGQLVGPGSSSGSRQQAGQAASRRGETCGNASNGAAGAGEETGARARLVVCSKMQRASA